MMACSPIIGTPPVARKHSSRYDQLADRGVINIAGTRIKRSSFLEQGTDADGQPFVRAAFRSARHPEGGFSVRLDSLLEAPLLIDPFGEALVAYGRTRRPATVKAMGAQLFAFVDFLRSKSLLHIGAEGLTEPLMRDFGAWLNASGEDGTAKLAPATRYVYFRVVKTLIGEMGRDQRWKDIVPPLASLNQRLWRDVARRRKVIPPLDRDLFLRIYSRCSELVAERAKLLDGRDAALEQAAVAEKTGAEASLFASTLARIVRVYDGSLPSPRSLARKGTVRFHWDIMELGGYRPITSLFAPRHSDLVPFVVLLAAHTAYNPETLITLERSAIRFDDLLGQRRIRLAAEKARSGRRQVRSFAVDSTPDNPAFLLGLLDRWTSSVRRQVPPAYADRVFLCDARNRAGHHAWLGTQPFHGTLQQWCWREGLPRFTLQQIRTTVLDIVHDLSNGDLRAIMAAANHRRPETFTDHYKSAAAGERLNERLGVVTIHRERWLVSSGQVDPRERLPREDQGAATPGWHCADPFDGPSAFSKGQLCSAYGVCPVCPHALLDITSPVACARAHELASLIDAAQLSVEPARWLKRWSPIKTRLQEQWLPHFSDRVMDEASRMSMPAMAPVE